jgi:hypothetical protein
MHTMDKVWIAAAAGVAMASIALSVLIVRFVPEDPYATQERRTAQVEASRAARTGQSHVLDGQRLYEPGAKNDVARRNDDLGINVACAAIGVVVMLSSMFAFFAWEDRRASAAKDQPADQGFRSRDWGPAAHVERRHFVRRTEPAGPEVVSERRQSSRRVVDGDAAAAG